VEAAAAAVAAWQPSDDEAEACSQPMRTDNAYQQGWRCVAAVTSVTCSTLVTQPSPCQDSYSRRHASARCRTYYAELLCSAQNVFSIVCSAPAYGLLTFDDQAIPPK